MRLDPTVFTVPGEDCAGPEGRRGQPRVLVIPLPYPDNGAVLFPCTPNFHGGGSYCHYCLLTRTVPQRLQPTRRRSSWLTWTGTFHSDSTFFQPLTGADLAPEASQLPCQCPRADISTFPPAANRSLSGRHPGCWDTSRPSHTGSRSCTLPRLRKPGHHGGLGITTPSCLLPRGVSLLCTPRITKRETLVQHPPCPCHPLTLAGRP